MLEWGRFSKAACLAVVGLVLCTASATLAGGLNLTENGTPDAGWAAAGRAAMADDPTTVFGNPAGMDGLDRSQLLLGVQPLFVRSEFEVDESSFGGGNSDLDDTAALIGAAYVHRLSDQWSVGTSLGTLLGGELDYGGSSAGRYYAIQADLVTMEWNGAGSYHVNENISLGIGLRVMYAALKQKSAINNMVPEQDSGFPDGRLKFDDTDIAPGVVLGTLIRPDDDLRIGLRYRSEIDLEFQDRPSISGLGPTLEEALSGLKGTNVKMDLTLPQDILLSAHYQVSEPLELMLNLGWEDWSKFGRSDITVRGPASAKLTRDLNYDDTWHVAIGGRYRLDELWRVSLGIAYDSSPVGSSDRTPDLPLDRQIRVGTGVQYDWNEDITLGTSYTYVNLGDADIRQQSGPLTGNLKGDYGPNEIHTFNLTLIWRL